MHLVKGHVTRPQGSVPPIPGRKPNFLQVYFLLQLKSQDAWGFFLPEARAG